MNCLKVWRNDELIISFNRDERLPGRQRSFLQNLSKDIDQGIHLAGDDIAEPTEHQRAQYVSMILLQALDNNNQALMKTASAYLLHYHNNLLAIRSRQTDEQITMTLEYI